MDGVKKCSGSNCPMQYGFDTSKCSAMKDCPYYTPEHIPDFSGLDDVIDMFHKQFDISLADRPKVKMLCDMYAVQYLATIYGISTK